MHYYKADMHAKAIQRCQLMKVFTIHFYKMHVFKHFIYDLKVQCKLFQQLKKNAASECQSQL